jgi:putative metalloenzyme radical SAM/SPASM domain maturase
MAAPSALAPAPPALRPHPSRLFVEVTTRCNLRCAMCPREAPGGAIRDGDLSRETFARLAPALPHLEALVLNGIGEPLLHPHLEAFVAEARRAMPAGAWVGFQTNGQLLGPERAASLAAAGVDRVCISADAVSPELFSALRRGGQQARVAAAVTALHDAARRRGRPIDVGLEVVVMRENLAQLPALVRWGAEHGIGFVLATHLLAYDRRLAGAAAFEPHSDQAQALFRAWRARAAADGVDLGRSLELMFRFRPSAEDDRVVGWVRRMMADAADRGITLSLERLLGADGDLRREVEVVFGEAAAVARAAGITLTLPATAPRRERRCDFVEGGGAFVAWDGAVHPCYFLWHRYECHVAGLGKRVRPRVLGNVADDGGLLKIWNAAAPRAFRDEVRRYEFPFCYDCGFALCDLAADEEFTQDCHVGGVPCGSCLWSTGVFRCLQ